ncbi:MAG: DUF3089 domain-containing protein [Acidimicrobiales bacterium]|nr:DUF3089 domain-containing protein [Acidimicrobiales bacterium]
MTDVRSGQVRRPGGPGFALVLLVGSLLLVAPVAGPAGAAARTIRASSTTVWLCRPGQLLDPCAYSPDATSVAPDGETSPPPALSDPRAHAFDCFYVYPTSSNEPGDNADLRIQPVEREVAAVQASRFSQVCNVWAPMYRQATLGALNRGAAVDPAVVATAYDSLLAAWKDYLAHDNHGRPVVFIGHSQGAAMLIKLLQAQVDPSASLRRRMVSAIVLGGNVQVPVGRDAGGSFRSIPTCGSSSQTGCVIAYSTFGSPPPAAAFFARPGQGVSLQSGQTAKVGQEVACVNPVTFSSRAGPLRPYFLSVTSVVPHVTVGTPWVTYPDLYTAQCEQSGGASWLQVTATATAGDERPTVSATLGPLWGYHLQDVTLALGNLVADVASEEAAYR